jgi:hypothetical protein
MHLLLRNKANLHRADSRSVIHRMKHIHILHRVAFRATATLFLLLSQKKQGKEKATPHHDLMVSLRYSVNKASAELALTDHTLRGLSRHSNRSSTKSPCSLPLLGVASRGWGNPLSFTIISLNKHRHSRESGNPN